MVLLRDMMWFMMLQEELLQGYTPTFKCKSR